MTLGHALIKGENMATEIVSFGTTPFSKMARFLGEAPHISVYPVNHWENVVLAINGGRTLSVTFTNGQVTKALWDDGINHEEAIRPERYERMLYKFRWLKPVRDVLENNRKDLEAVLDWSNILEMMKDAAN